MMLLTRTGYDWILPGVCGLGLHFRLDGFRLIYAGIAVFMWVISGIFSREYRAVLPLFLGHFCRYGRGLFIRGFIYDLYLL